MRNPDKHKNRIESLELMDSGQPADFVFKTMKNVATEHENRDHLPHRHHYYSVIWIISGEGIHLVDFKSYPAQSGTVFFISPEQVHHLQMKDPHDGFVLLFTENFLERQGIGSQWVRQSGFFFRCDDVAPLQIENEDDASELDKIIRMIAGEYLEKRTGYLDAIGALLRLFLLQCNRISSIKQPVRQERSRPAVSTVKQFKDLLDIHFAEWHKVAEYARALHLTPNYLNELLSQETGSSAKDMILARIMLEAKRYATHSEMSVKEVAYQLGFTDPAHFSKLFKQCENQGFTAFRGEIRKKYS
jgi:AraC-like DNA-binding protein